MVDMLQLGHIIKREDIPKDIWAQGSFCEVPLTPAKPAEVTYLWFSDQLFSFKPYKIKGLLGASAWFWPEFSPAKELATVDDRSSIILDAHRNYNNGCEIRFQPESASGIEDIRAGRLEAWYTDTGATLIQWGVFHEQPKIRARRIASIASKFHAGIFDSMEIEAVFDLAEKIDNTRNYMSDYHHLKEFNLVP